MGDPQNVYIGRGRIVFIDGKRYPPQDSIWANPFKVGKDGTLEEIIEKYEIYISQKLENEPELRRKLEKLKGKTLGCWCLDNPETKNIICHGQILQHLISNKPWESSK
jgi:hypothetical protein